MHQSGTTADAIPQSTGAKPGWQFASDNTAGVCPEAWAVVEQANAGCVASYGDDQWTARACTLVREMFE